MSKFKMQETDFADEDCLVQALHEVGYKLVEIHQTATNLFGYQGDKRAEVAHVIVRREHIGRASNDIGFVRNVNGSYSAIISDFDSNRHGQAWVNRLKDEYNEKKVIKEAPRQGLRFVGKSVNLQGRRELQFVKMGGK